MTEFRYDEVKRGWCKTSPFSSSEGVQRAEEESMREAARGEGRGEGTRGLGGATAISRDAAGEGRAVASRAGVVRICAAHLHAAAGQPQHAEPRERRAEVANPGRPRPVGESQLL